jgi:DMSO/TMAO reductase YedYZ molybdopterin-dependent catalytic subunit
MGALGVEADRVAVAAALAGETNVAVASLLSPALPCCVMAWRRIKAISRPERVAPAGLWAAVMAITSTFHVFVAASFILDRYRSDQR